MQDLLTLDAAAGGTYVIGAICYTVNLRNYWEEVLLLMMLITCIKDYANEKQLINIVMMALMSALHFIVLNPVCILSLIPGKILRFNVLHNPIVNNLPRLK